MIRLSMSVRTLAIEGSIAVLLVTGGIILLASSHHTTPSTAAKTVKTATTKSPAKKTTGAVTGTTQPTNLTTSNTSNADQQAAADASAQPVTDACSLLTPSIARLLLGASASTSTPSSTTSLQATGTSISSCAYTSGSGNIQLTIRKATSSVGTSDNDVTFGSGRPTNAVTVQGYGQSAYWDPSKATLNVLGSNNWYIISRSSDTQADAEAAANLLKSGF